MDIIKANKFPENVIAGLATGNSNKNHRLSFYKTDNYSAMDTNYARDKYERYLKTQYNSNLKFIYQNQKHTDIIRLIRSNSINNTEISDAMITDCKNVILNISIADCAAVLIYDKNKKVISAVHSGWRGTRQNIVTKTLIQLFEQYNSIPNDIFINIMPSASNRNYEVGEEFFNYFSESIVRKNDKVYFDNQKEIKNQLLKCNVLEENIMINSECTIENNRFHSHRRDNAKAGRMNAFIGIIE